MDTPNRLRAQDMRSTPRDTHSQPSGNPTPCVASLEAKVSRPQPTADNQMSQMSTVTPPLEFWDTAHPHMRQPAPQTVLQTTKAKAPS